MTQETNVIHCGDNLEIMRDIMKFPDESVDLIYLDPPFFSGKDYDVIWEGINGNDHSEVRSFKDTEWYRVQCPECDREVVKAERFCSACGTSLEHAKITSKNDIYAYIDWMIPRLREMHRILKSDGSIYIHCDHHAVHYLKIEMDRIFNLGNFRNEIMWQRTKVVKGTSDSFGNNHDTILLYSKSDVYLFNTLYNDNEKVGNYIVELETGRKFTTSPIFMPGKSPKKLIFKDRGEITAPKDKRFRWAQKTYDKYIEDNPYIIHWSKNGIPRKKDYLDEFDGIQISDIWTDISLSSGAKERLGYPTQKPEKLLERIIKASSNKNDIVFDPFCGCGTSLAVAKRLNRQYIGIDVSPTACPVVAKRLKIPNWRIKGMPMTTDELHKLEPEIFQQWVCDHMEADNTSSDYEKPSGPDDGIDGVVKSNLNTTGFEGALIQVKRSKGVGPDPIIKLKDAMDERNDKLEIDNKLPMKNGFVVALSFGKGSIDKVTKYRMTGKANIILVKAEDIAEKGYFER